MICDSCKKETDTIYEVQGYLGTYDFCENCFKGEDNDDSEED